MREPEKENGRWGRPLPVVHPSGKVDGAEIVTPVIDSRKREATAIAHLALKGAVVHRLVEGGYLCCWGPLTRELAGLDELEAHARRTGAMR